MYYGCIVWVDYKTYSFIVSQSFHHIQQRFYFGEKHIGNNNKDRNNKKKWEKKQSQLRIFSNGNNKAASIG